MKGKLPVLTALIVAICFLCACGGAPSDSVGVSPEQSSSSQSGNDWGMDGDNDLDW